jgi:hypothetical protein
VSLSSWIHRLPCKCKDSINNDGSLSFSSSRRQEVVRLAGLEPAAHGLGNRCSIHLSYRRTWSSGLSHFGCSENRRRITGDFLHGFRPVLLRSVRISSYHLRIFPASEIHQGLLRGSTHFHPACPRVPQTVRRHPGEISMSTGTVKSPFKLFSCFRCLNMSNFDQICERSGTARRWVHL